MNKGSIVLFFRRNRSSGGYLAKKTASSLVYKFCRAGLIFGLCFLILQPLINKLSVSVMKEQDLFDPSVINIPRNFTWDNYILVNELMRYGSSLAQTFGIVFGSSLLQILACSMAGYGFARYKFPLKDFWFMCVMLIIIVPPHTIMAPLYLNFRFFDVFGIFRLVTGKPLNLLSNLGSYFLLSATGMGLKSGLYIFILRQYFRGVPKELEEAAYVDGCGRMRTFVQIMLPDASPMIVSCFLFSFVWQWTDSFYSSLFLNRFSVLSSRLAGLADRIGDYYKVFESKSTGIVYFPSPGYIQTLISTGTIYIIAPLIVLYLVAQKAFVESLSQTGIKM